MSNDSTIDDEHLGQADLDTDEQPLPPLPAPGLAAYRKALVAVLAAVAQAAALFGFDVDLDAAGFALAVNVIAAYGVWRAPNAPRLKWDNEGRETVDQ